jgi:putative sterol carrier protein
MRFMLPDLRVKMREGLDEIRSGSFAGEWAAEREAGCPTLNDLRQAARSLPLAQLERDLREALGDSGTSTVRSRVGRAASRPEPPRSGGRGLFAQGLAQGFARLRRRGKLSSQAADDDRCTQPLSPELVEPVLREFVAAAVGDKALQAFGQSKTLLTHYLLSDPALEFYLSFDHGTVTSALGPPPAQAQVRIQAAASVLDGMLTGRINAMRAAMSGRLTFSGDARLAMSVQRIQADLCRLYSQARQTVMDQND